jgi:hypothetical protein
MSGSDEAPLPAPVLDHVVINARGRIEDAAQCYRRLGFSLTPLGRHTLGSMNHLAVLARDYIELVGVDTAAATQRRELLDFPDGLNAVVFATEDADAVHRALAPTHAPVEAPLDFARPVTIAGASIDARFRVVRVAAAAAPYGRLYFCQHLTPQLVWRDEWRGHPNGAVAVARAVIAADDPVAVGTLYRGLFGADCLRPVAGGLSLAMGLARLDILTHAALAAAFGAAAPEGRGTFMAALGVRTRSLDRAREVLGELARDEGHRLVVAATDAFGLALEFAE